MAGGSGGSQGGSQNQNTTSQVILPAWLQNTAQSSLANAQTVADRPYQANPYSNVAALTPDQQAAYQTIRDMQGSTAGAYSAAEGAAGGLLGQVQPITADQINASTASLMNPYTTAVVDPAVAQMRQSLDTSINATRANASNVGAFGGSRLGVAEGAARGQETLGEGQLVGGLLSSGYNTAQQAALGLAGTNLAAGQWATSLLPQLATAGATEQTREAAALEGVGRAEQGQTQAEMDQAAANWQDQWNYPLIQQQILEQALTATPYGGTTSTISTGTSTGAPKTIGSRIAGVAGGALSGAALGSVVPGIGTAIGAVGGGLVGLLGGL